MPCAARLRTGLTIGILAVGVHVALLAGCAKHGASLQAAHVLRISQRNEPVDLDPATASLPDEFFIIRALAEGLLTPNPAGGAPLPAAAERYDVSADGLTYTFHLRNGLQWSNGEPLTADDFVASFRRVLTPATAAPKAHLFFSVANARAFATGALSDFHAVGIRALDPQTIVIRLGRRTANFPQYVASGPWIPVNVRTVARFGRTWTHPNQHVGNGPFVLAEWRPQQRIVVKRNSRFRNAATVRLAEIQFVRFDSQDTEERAYRAGQIDVTMAVPQTKLEVYARERPAELHHAALAETRFLSFNTTRKPLDDARVRRALSLAIDREKIVRQVLRGGQTPADRLLSPALLATGTDRGTVVEGSVRPTFDPETARRLLAEAGYPGGRDFPHLEFSGWDRNPVLEAIQQMWRHELGVDLAIVVHEAKVHLAALNTGSYDVAFVTNLLDVRDPLAALGDFATGAANNFPHWHSAEFDRLLATAEDDPEAAAGPKTVAAENLLLESAVLAPVYFNAQNWLMSPRVHHWEQDALWQRRYDDVDVE